MTRNSEVDEANTKLDSPLSAELESELRALLLEGRTIEAVKCCRAALNCDLVTAKAQVDALSGDSSDDQQAPASLLSPLGIGVLIVLLSLYLYVR